MKVRKFGHFARLDRNKSRLDTTLDTLTNDAIKVPKLRHELEQSEKGTFLH